MSSEIDGHMLAEVAVLKTQVKHLTDMLHEQKRTLESQNEVLKELMAMANKGKGSLWMFMAMGGIIGAVISNIQFIASIFKH